jgi:hypothetical protein
MAQYRYIQKVQAKSQQMAPFFMLYYTQLVCKTGQAENKRKSKLQSVGLSKTLPTNRNNKNTVITKQLHRNKDLHRPFLSVDDRDLGT